MNEFDKKQNQGAETGAQGDKPAFGQFDKEQDQDQGRQTEQGEGRQEEFAGTDTPEEGRARRERGGERSPQFTQKGEEIDQGQQEQGQAGLQQEQRDQQR
jgi:hypothetical protein